MAEEEKPKAMGQVIQIDEGRIRDHLGEMVRGTVEEALNAMLDAEADPTSQIYLFWFEQRCVVGTIRALPVDV